MGTSERYCVIGKQYLKIEKPAKDVAIEIYDRVKTEGYSTDYCYSSTFLQDSKDIAIRRARKAYNGEFLDEIIEEIKKL